MIPQFLHSRMKVLAVITLGLMAVFVVRLFQMQVLQHNYYSALAVAESTKKWELPAVRGEVYALDGDTPKKIVLNETVYKLWVDPSVIINAKSVLSEIKKVAGGNMLDNADQLIAKKSTQYQVLALGLTYDQANAIKSQNFYGVGFESSDQRVYPEGQLASQVLGFVNGEGQGQYGIEGYLNSELAGKPGLLKTVTDVRDVPLTIGKDNINIPAQDGKNVVLTIDENVQQEAEQVLPAAMAKVGATQGSMLVMDPNTGRVLAMANEPTYNPNNIDQVTNVSVFNNPIISNQYEPASVMKTLTMSAGVDQGVMTANSMYNNTGQITIDGFAINNAYKYPSITGNISMQTVLTWSLNTGTVTMAQWLGGGTINEKARDILYDYYYNKFRLGQLTGIQLQGEIPGDLVGPDEGSAPELRYANMTFGQGVDVTTLQMASAFSAIVNGGTYYKPTIIAGTISDDGVYTPAAQYPGTQILKASTSDTLREMTHEARQNFGYNSQDPAGYYIGGKTGTAQTLINGAYSLTQTTGTYVGYGGTPGQKPAYVIMVYVAKPNTALGGQHAIEVFTPMSNWMIKYLKLPPKQ